MPPDGSELSIADRADARSSSPSSATLVPTRFLRSDASPSRVTGDGNRTTTGEPDFRHEPEAFVLVQYKRMRQEGERWLYRPAADRNYARELQRMQELRTALLGAATASARPLDYRLNGDPFYFKVCKPSLMDQSSTQLVKGMYIPLAYWEVLQTSPVAVGKRGGIGVGYDTPDHRWLDNTTFAHLVADAWIGTSGDATRLISEIVRTGLRLDRAVVVAIEEGSRLRRRAFATA